MNRLLTKEKKYYGQYVALRDFNKPKVIAHGKDILKVFNEAIRKGIREPVMLYIPEKNMVHIY